MTRKTDPLTAILGGAALRERGHRLIEQLATYLDRATERVEPVQRHQTPESMANAWPVRIAAAPQPPQVGDEMVGRLIEDALHQHHPRCMGHQVAVPWPAAIAYELVAAVLNNGMASYESGPVSSAIEKNLTDWLATEVVGMSGAARGVLTSGGTLGTLTALLAARHHRSAFTIEEGSVGRHAILCSAHSHYAVARAAMVMGWGTEAVIPVRVDDRLRLDPKALPDARRRAAEGGRQVVALVATAGTSVSGAIDPIEPLADYAEKDGLWFHVDGAHGASLLFSDRYRGRLKGIERADSVVWDAHKLLGLPALSTLVLFRDGRASYAPFAVDATYLFNPEEASSPHRWYDFGNRNLECTKRMMSVTLYLTLAALGTDLLDRSISHHVSLAERFAEMVRAHPSFELAVAPDCNIVCFRVCGAAGPLSCDIQDDVRRRINAEGDFFFTRSEIAGEAWMRVTLMNPLTEERDLVALLERVVRFAPHKG